MANRYTQNVHSAQTHFTKAPVGELEFSTMHTRPREVTTFNAGEIVPIFCQEVLPHDTFDLGLDFVIRQTTVAVPTMDTLVADFYAFFVPNRVVNKSWKNVMGENSSGAWAQPEPITLAFLGGDSSGSSRGVKVPVGSVADHYGYPTQDYIPLSILRQCHDLKFRGYLEIYNTYFRDQNYQPPIPYSKLNVYEGFFQTADTGVSLNGQGSYHLSAGQESTGQFGFGAVAKEFNGDGGVQQQNIMSGLSRKCAWSALSQPLKANKLHDYFTSVLPSPQRGRQVAIPLSGDLALNSSTTLYKMDNPLRFGTSTSSNNFTLNTNYTLYGNAFTSKSLNVGATTPSPTVTGLESPTLDSTNLYVSLSNSEVSIPIEDIRMSAALQQVYEILGRGGSRYTEYINSFFGLDIDNPFDDIPTYLGHFRNELDLFQTAQTSASPQGVGTAQGNLAAFGYTAKSGKLFNYTFKEHGYIHIFAVVRQKNTYCSLLSRDNFRMSMMDYYQYPLANITEQPVFTREINPFLTTSDGVFGYQEAWAEYRMIPDRVSGYMRPGVDMTLSNWNYADEYNKNLTIANGDWIQSNAREVVERTTALQDLDLPQFKGQFFFSIKMERPMPTYSVAGLDII